MAATRPYDQLPPGVYFDPSHEECVRDYLRPWIARGCAGEEPLHDAVFPVDVYRHSPDELRRMFPPGHARGVDRWWYFLTLLRRSVASRGKRLVPTGGYWRIDQKIRDLDDGDCASSAWGERRTFGFYLPKEHKTPWLMEEIMLTDGNDAGKGKGKGIPGAEDSVPVLYRIYVSPRASNEDRREILGEEGVAVDQEGKPKPVCVAVGDEYFDMLAARLPASNVRHARHAGGHHVAAPPPGGFGHQMQAGQVAPPPPPEFIAHHNFQAAPPPVVHGHHQHFHVQNAGLYDAPPPEFIGHHNFHAAQLQVVHQQSQAAPPPAVHGHHQHYYVQNAGFYDAAPPPPDVPGDHQHYSVQNAVGFYDAPPPPPAFHGDYQHYYVQNAGFYDAPPPPPAVPGDHQHYYVQNTVCFYDAPPQPPIHVPNPPQQEEDVEEMHRVEKKQRLTCESPAQRPVAMNSTNHETQQDSETTPAQEARDASNLDTAAIQEPAAPPAPTPPQEEEMNPRSGTPSPPPVSNDDDVSRPQLPPIVFDAAFRHDVTNKDPSPGSGSSDLSNLTHDSFGNDLGIACSNLFWFDDDGQPVDTFRLPNNLQYDFDDFDPSWIDDGFGPSLQAPPALDMN